MAPFATCSWQLWMQPGLSSLGAGLMGLSPRTTCFACEIIAIAGPVSVTDQPAVRDPDGQQGTVTALLLVSLPPIFSKAQLLCLTGT